MSSKFPRIIAPENLEIGDKVRVEFPAKRGVKMIHEGVIHSREDHGSVRYLYTNEGATLFSWEVGRHNLTVTLLSRPPAEQTPLSMFDDELRDRIK